MPEQNHSSAPSVICYHIGQTLLLNTYTNSLTCGDKIIELEHRLVMLLVYFIQHQGKVLPKDLLLGVIWQGKVVSDDSLAVAISHLRKALGDNPRAPQFIKTIPGVGYQFITDAYPAGEKTVVNKINQVLKNLGQNRNKRLFIALIPLAIVIAFGLYFFAGPFAMKSVPVNSHNSVNIEPAYRQANQLLSTADAENWRLAITMYRNAIYKTGESAEAYAGIADAKIKLLGEKITLKENCREVIHYLQKSLQINPGLAVAHRSIANAFFWCQRDDSLAEQHYAKAIMLDTKDDAALIDYAQFLLARERFAESLANVERARTINPLNYSVPTVVWIYQMQRRDDLALRELERISTTESDNRYYHISAYRIFKHMAVAGKTFEHWLWLMHEAGFSQSELDEASQLFGAKGLPAVNQWLLGRKESKDLGEYTPPLAWARYALAAQDYDLALDYLEAAYHQGQLPLLWANVDPAYDNVRNTARFQHLLTQLKETVNK